MLRRTAIALTVVTIGGLVLPGPVFSQFDLVPDPLDPADPFTIQRPVPEDEAALVETFKMLRPFPVNAGEDELDRLKKMRLNTAVELLQRHLAFYHAGTINIDRLSEVMRTVVTARLGLEVTPEEEVALREFEVELVRVMEASEEMKISIGTGVMTNLLAARLHRIEAEIRALEARRRLGIDGPVPPVVEILGDPGLGRVAPGSKRDPAP